MRSRRSASPARIYEFSLSPDGRRTALSAEDQKTGRIDVFILDMERGVSERLTSGKSDSSMPLWRRDGTHVIFRAREGGLLDVWEKGLQGGDRSLLLKSDKDKEPTDVSPDGRYLAFGVSNLSIWMLPLLPPGPAFPYLQSGFHEEGAHSPRTAAGWPSSPSRRAARRSTSRPSRSRGRHVRISDREEDRRRDGAPTAWRSSF